MEGKEEHVSGADSGVDSPSLKTRTARTIKWNTIDSLVSQLIYAVVGIVLANILSQEDFGLVGVLLIFQAFATILTDSGFGAALLQKKVATDRDYSSVLWFNLGVSLFIYVVLFACASLIARAFGDARLVSLSRVMFLAFVINGLSIVQVNRLKKRMEVRLLAIADLCGLVVSGGVGMAVALCGHGAWALVWQTVSLAAVKTLLLWTGSGWRPRGVLSLDSIKGIWRMAMSILSTATLNTLCLNLYNIVIAGTFSSLASLGVYTQADKWSKMGSASISQILTSSFVPLLARVQDDAAAFAAYVRKIDRFTSFIALPVLCGMAIVGTPLFHFLFGSKWDAAIPLFQILCIRGIFVVAISLFGNYILSLGKGRLLVKVEVIKDVLMVVAILATVWRLDIELLVWGQLAATLLTFVAVLVMTAIVVGRRWTLMLADTVPFLLATVAMCAACLGLRALIGSTHSPTPLSPGCGLGLLLEILAGAAVYLLLLTLTHTPEPREALAFLKKKKKK